MLRRLLVVFAVLAASVVGSVPVSASAGTQSQTFHFSSNPPFAVMISCSVDAGFNVINEDNGNGVIHMTGNANGFWITGTFTGDIQIAPALSATFDKMGNVTSFVPDPSRPTASGHVEDWFGGSFNLTVGIQHDAVNAQVTTSDGQSIGFHMIDYIQLSPPTTPGGPPGIIRSFTDFHCV
jgi:hypothetical protein